MIKKQNSLCFALAMALVLLSGCAAPLLYSEWRDRKITIDGKYSDWPNMQTYYSQSGKIVVNLLNDSEYLYVCLITRNREMEINLMEKGLVAWFDHTAKKSRTLGIRFPIGLKRMGATLDEEHKDITSDWEDQQDKSGLIDRQKERLRDKNFIKHLEDVEELQGRLEIITEPLNKKEGYIAGKKAGAPKGFPEDKPNEFSLEEAAKLGIEARLGHENGYFVYELKLPLIKSAEHTYAVETIVGRLIEVGLEIPGSSLATRRYIQDSEGFQIWMTVDLSPGPSG
jgi:hypothetical protein